MSDTAVIVTFSMVLITTDIAALLSSIRLKGVEDDQEQLNKATEKVSLFMHLIGLVVVGAGFLLESSKSVISTDLSVKFLAVFSLLLGMVLILFERKIAK